MNRRTRRDYPRTAGLRSIACEQLKAFVCRCLFAWGILTSFAADAHAFGDYVLEIDPHYRIVRANSLDVSLVRADSASLIYTPRDFPSAGPIVGYEVTPTHILLRTVGRKPRQLFAGDTFEDVDDSQEFYFLVDKADDRLTGPLTNTDFFNQAIVRQHGSPQWIAPTHPRPEELRELQWLVLGYGVVLFGGPVLLLLFFGVLIWWILRRAPAKP